VPRQSSSELIIGELNSVMDEYARRGVFSGRSFTEDSQGRFVCKVIWHGNQLFFFRADLKAGSITIPIALPNVPPNSEMYEELKEFVRSRHDAALPLHRRVERSKAALECSNRRANVSLKVVVKGQHYSYGMRMLVNIVQEIYLLFLPDRLYFDYMAKTLGIAAQVGR
jgi:hypothetical protein